MNRLFKF